MEKITKIYIFIEQREFDTFYLTISMHSFWSRPITNIKVFYTLQNTLWNALFDANKIFDAFQITRNIVYIFQYNLRDYAGVFPFVMPEKLKFSFEDYNYLSGILKEKLTTFHNFDNIDV